jgi:hypothetical protein
MQQFVRFSGLVILGLALCLPSFAGDEKKTDPNAPKEKEKAGDPEKKVGKDKGGDPEKKDVKGKEDPPKDKLVYGVHFTGKLTQMSPGGKKDFTVQVTRKVAELNQGAVNRIQDLQRQYFQQQQTAATARNLQQRQQALNQMANIQGQMVQAQREMYNYKDVSKDYPLRGSENIKVRSYQPPLDYDEKGNVKKYTNEELKTLRGTEGLPGYNAEWDALRPGQVVHVYMSKPAAPVKGAEKKGKKIDELDDEAAMQARPEVVMIMILYEPPMK